MSWTDERVDELKALWLQGKTASQIAKELGDVTRNAVIGKVHRLGLSGRPSPIKRRTRKASEPKKVVQAKKSAAPVTQNNTPDTTNVRPIRAPMPVIEPLNGGACLLDLKESMCKWPIGDPKSPDFRFCGHKKAEGLPYCEAHAAVAYQVSSRRKRSLEDELAKIS